MEEVGSFFYIENKVFNLKVQYISPDHGVALSQIHQQLLEDNLEFNLESLILKNKDGTIVQQVEPEGVYVLHGRKNGETIPLFKEPIVYSPVYNNKKVIVDIKSSCTIFSVQYKDSEYRPVTVSDKDTLNQVIEKCCKTFDIEFSEEFVLRSYQGVLLEKDMFCFLEK